MQKQDNGSKHTCYAHYISKYAMHNIHSIRCKIVLHHNSVHFLHCHSSCNKHWFIFCTDIYSVLGHGDSQQHLLHSVVLHRRSWQRSLLTTSGSPHSVWTELLISYNHSTELRQLMQALLCVDSRDHSSWTAKSLQQEKAGGGVPSKRAWNDDDKTYICLYATAFHHQHTYIGHALCIYAMCELQLLVNFWSIFYRLANYTVYEEHNVMLLYTI